MHPYSPWVAQILLVPAFVFSRATDGGSLALALMPGVFFAVTAVTWATNHDGGITRFESSQARNHKTWMLRTGALERDKPSTGRKRKAEDLNERIPAAMAIGVWSIILLVSCVVGLVHVVA